jgi:hypothetical protein
MVEQLLTYHFHKVIRVINSCETEEHIYAAKKMISYFVNYWKHKLKAEVLRHYLKYLNILFNHKKNSILNYE